MRSMQFKLFKKIVFPLPHAMHAGEFVFLKIASCLLHVEHAVCKILEIIIPSV